MVGGEESRYSWEEPMDESIDSSIRATLGIVHEGIEALLEYLQGFSESLPQFYEFFKKHPDFKEELEATSIENIRESLGSMLEQLEAGCKAIEELASPGAYKFYKMLSQPGVPRMVTGMAKLLLFLKKFEHGQS